ncbi:ThuA domain-containing protein [Mucilaginibacter sp. SG564]|uniref:ThuA domain-containing protein n=1 Tax=Mucilaginibacter sp. SG564 TaxID=2587022 RepID=UPI001555CB0F|nr:ThuA domain-containing protein [Mucilaginibacter sp. SG564]NOW95595.1 type 1 glutamine amidotransferase [Mucilaginibacter sp. SG564]
MKYLKYSLIITACLLCAVVCAKNRHKKIIRVLIVDGFSNHDWKQTTKMVKQILEGPGLFQITVSTIPINLQDTTVQSNWEPNFKKYDVVIQNTNNIQNPKLKWPLRVQRELENYVKNGGGLYILHSANNAYPDWPGYNQMIGLGWRSKNFGYALRVDSLGKIDSIPPGQGQDTYHNDRSNLLICVLNEHPINAAYPKQWLTPDVELYRFARGPAQNLKVLSYANDPLTGINWPVEWIVKYGKGKVYVSSMGHLWKGDTYPPGYRCVGFQTTMIRAVEWLGTGKVTFPLPKNFPTSTAVSMVPPEVK